MTRVILRRDDFGIACHATGRILDVWRAGHLDGFSIIANGDAIRQIPGALMAAPELKARISVHINLI